MWLQPLHRSPFVDGGSDLIDLIDHCEDGDRFGTLDGFGWRWLHAPGR